MLRIEEKGIFKVVTDHSQLEWMTQQGWRLVAVLESESTMMMNDTENFPFIANPNAGMYNSGVGYTTATATRHHPFRSQSFLLFMDEESVVKKLNGELIARDVKIAAASETEKLAVAYQKSADELAAKLKDLIETHRQVLDKGIAERKASEDYKAEVADKMKRAEEILLREKERRQTAYERVANGEYDDRIESVEERDVR